jgi:sterol 3beta-glucosyltransferase
MDDERDRPVRLTILTIGSRGDVQPILALGRELTGHGHDVRVATHPRFAPLVSSAGLEFAPLAEGRISRGPHTAEGRRWMRLGRRLPSWLGHLRDGQSVARGRFADALTACAGADAIVATEFATLIGWQMAVHLRRPFVRVWLSLPRPPGRREAALRQVLWLLIRPWLLRIRRELGLPGLPLREPLGGLAATGALGLGAYSAAVGPPPTPRCGYQGGATGYWWLSPSPDPEPPSALWDFLAAGPPPVCVGFGSMTDADPEGTTALVVEALRRVGRRGILIRGEYGLRGTDLPPTVFALDSVSHERLFGHCAAIVHHASAGTTAAALRAGVPSVTVPHMGEQLRWANRVRELGVGTAPIPRRRLSATGLQEAIGVATGDHAMRRRAAALARSMRAEDGPVRAVELLERRLDPARRPDAPVAAS